MWGAPNAKLFRQSRSSIDLINDESDALGDRGDTEVNEHESDSAPTESESRQESECCPTESESAPSQDVGTTERATTDHAATEHTTTEHAKEGDPSTEFIPAADLLTPPRGGRRIRHKSSVEAASVEKSTATTKKTLRRKGQTRRLMERQK